MSTQKAGALGCILGAIIVSVIVGAIWFGTQMIASM